MLHVGHGERHALGLAVDPHRDPAGGERPGWVDDSPEPAVEMSGGSEARDPDPGAGSVHRGELAEGVPGRLEALVGGELAEPDCLGVVLRDPGAVPAHEREVPLRFGVPLVAARRYSRAASA